jgi:hypothetical protein
LFHEHLEVVKLLLTGYAAGEQRDRAGNQGLQEWSLRKLGISIFSNARSFSGELGAQPFL